MNESDFKDSNTYHSTMFTSATKMSQLLISIDKVDHAKKYLDIAKYHNGSRRSFDNNSMSSDSSSCSSSSSSDDSSEFSDYS